MKKSLKRIAVASAVVLCVLMVILWGFLLLLNPNRFKPFISAKVEQYTGHELIMDGDLSWTLFPTMGIKTGHLVLKNPEGFSQTVFAEVDSATVSLAMLPLLHQQLQSDGIWLNGLKLHLIKNAQGNVNWNFAPRQTKTSRDLSAASVATRGVAPSALMIESFALKQADISWVDETTKQSKHIKNLNLHASGIQFDHAFSVKANFDVIGRKGKLVSKVKMVSDIRVKPAQQTLSFTPLAMDMLFEQGQTKIELHTTGNLEMDFFKQTIVWSNLRITSENAMIDGQMAVFDMKNHPALVGHLRLQSMDLKQWLEQVGYKSDALQTLNDVTGEWDFIPSADAVIIKGNLTMGQANVNNIVLSHVQLPMLYQKNVLSLLSATAAFYQGKLKGDVKIDFSEKMPRYSWQFNAENVDVAALIRAISPKQTLTLAGIAQCDMQAITQGNSSDALINHLNGLGHLRISDAILRGVDMRYMIATATKKSVSIANTHETALGELTGSFMLHHGVLSNDDLLMSSHALTTKGQGSVQLSDKTLRYRLQTWLNAPNDEDKRDLKHFYGLPIPLDISGAVTHPVIRLDIETLAKAMTKQQQEKAQALVQKTLQERKLPAKAEKFLNHLLGS